jgi:Fe-S cluster assembly protein SufD
MKKNQGRATDQGVAEFLAHAERLPAAGKYLQDLRTAGRTKLEQIGFPTPRDEEWKYTDITSVTRFSGALAGVSSLNGSAGEVGKYLHGALRLVFVNGAFSPEASQVENLPPGVTVANLSSQWSSEAVGKYLGRAAGIANDDGPTALNTALVQEGALIHVAANVNFESPVEVLFYTRGDGAGATQPRVLVVAERGAQATVCETHAGSGAYFSNGVTEVFVGDNAFVDHYKLVRESDAGLHIGTLQVLAGRDARFSSHSLNLSGRLIRNNASARMDGEGASVTLNGVVLGRGEAHVDNHTAMDHARAHCTSHEKYAHILGGTSTAVFNGKIFVRPDAQKTDAVQSNRTLLLSPDATINTKPQLEILADDVKCTHGATIGQLDPTALFYLQARGIDKEQARALLTYAFAEEVLEGVRLDWLKESVEAELLAWL